MKEIVFGPSVHGSLRGAQFTGIGDYPKNWILDTKDDKGRIDKRLESFNNECIDKWKNSHAIGGSADDIINIQI